MKNASLIYPDPYLWSWFPPSNYKTPCCSLSREGTVYIGHWPAVAPLSGTIKKLLLYFTPDSVFMFLFTLMNRDEFQQQYPYIPVFTWRINTNKKFSKNGNESCDFLKGIEVCCHGLSYNEENPQIFSGPHTSLQLILSWKNPAASTR